MKRSRYLPLVILALTFIWYAALVIRFPTHGAIGDDPATYVQMALDLARRGTVTPEFPLFNNLYDKGFSWDAFLTAGYHVARETGTIAPNFAFGFPLLLAFAYRLFGEGALYWATPLMGALSLGMTFALANELWRELSPTRRYWIGALAALLLATTPKQIQLVLVPMSDVPTQLFCVVAVFCAVRVAARPDRFLGHPRHDPRMVAYGANVALDARAARPDRFLGHPRHATRTVAYGANVAIDTSAWKPVRSLGFVALCGLSLGIAYLMRHSALVLIVPLALVMTRWGNTKYEKIILIFVMLSVFVITISPDIVYRANVLGSPFAVESPESAQLNFLDAPRQILEMFAALFSVTGFGPIVLLAPLGWWVLARGENKLAGWVLPSWILAYIFFHAPLFLTGAFENSLRYLVPAYPALALLISVALVWLAEHAWNEIRSVQSRFSARAIILYGCAFLAVLLFGVAARAFANPERFVSRAYGWMSETARRDMDTLNERLPREAVIGVSDQMAGATMLYAQRAIFRPANFLEPAREFPQFLRKMKETNRAVFLLGDWECAGDASERLPKWVEEYGMREWRMEIGDLPYGCAQKIWEVR